MQVERKNVAQETTNMQETDCAELLSLLQGRPIVLVGMMGAGKTTVGRRLASRLGREFVDSDAEIEEAAGMSIDDYFATHGEPEFRAGEARVIARILEDRDIVLGTGGGAFINKDTRALIKENSVSVWIKADFDLLFSRVSRRATRPLLKTDNPRETLKKLIDSRYPIYAEADIMTFSRDVPHDVVAEAMISELITYLRSTKDEKNQPHAQ